VALVCAALVATVPPGMLAADDTYDQGRAALDRRDWEQAAELFRRSSRGGGPSADAALYWEAYALGKLSRVDRALAVLEELQRGYPDSRWLDDARALSAELRGATEVGGSDDELKVMALMGLVQSDPERALPHLEKFLASGRSPSVKEQALFLLLQTGLPRATEIVVRVAQDPQREPEVRAAAVRSLGIAGGARAPDLLADVYRSSGEVEVKRAVLEAYMVSGNEAGLGAVAESETNAALRMHAIQQLGAMGATAELEELFEKERSPEVRRTMLQAFMIAGHQAPVVRAARDATSPELRDEAIDLLGVMGGTSELWEIYDAEKSTEVRQRILRAQAVGSGGDRLVSIARSDPDPTLRAAAIEGLGIGGSVSADALTEIYRKEKVVEVKHAVLQALFVRGEVRALIAISRAESDPGLKREAVQLLAVSRSEEATEYMLELLDERK
jgi:hypothetical protein